MTIYAFTSITLNYLPKARILARTLRQHNPTIRMNLLVAEPIPEHLQDQFSDFDEVQSLHEMSVPDYTRWVFKHSVVEICTAQKGLYIDALLQRPDCEAAFYFDPDMAVFSSLDPLIQAFERGSILLTPHLLDAESTTEAILDNELCALRHGVYNLGFLGLKNSPQGRAFAQWWKSRLDEFCYSDIPAGIFTDQRWVDLAPAFFSEVHILRERGCNVATWNIAHRRITGDFKSGFRVNDEPLIFYHFSGFDSGNQETMLGRYAKDMPAAYTLRRWYIALAETLDEKKTSSLEWLYARFSNGEKITTEHRRLYRERGDLRDAFPNPFLTDDVNGSYYHWYSHHILRTDSSVSPSSERTGEHRATALGRFMLTPELSRPSPTVLFDAEYYLARYKDVAEHRFNPFDHYMNFGAKEGRDPHPLFDTQYYLAQVRNRPSAEANPLLDYVTEGAEQGLNPSPWFDTTYYRQQMAPSAQPRNPLQHFLESEGQFLDPHPLFSAREHIKACAADKSGRFVIGRMNPLIHYLRYGSPRGVPVPSRKPKTAERDLRRPLDLVLMIEDPDTGLQHFIDSSLASWNRIANRGRAFAIVSGSTSMGAESCLQNLERGGELTVVRLPNRSSLGPSLVRLVSEKLSGDVVFVSASVSPALHLLEHLQRSLHSETEIGVISPLIAGDPACHVPVPGGELREILGRNAESVIVAAGSDTLAPIACSSGALAMVRSEALDALQDLSSCENAEELLHRIGLEATLRGWRNCVDLSVFVERRSGKSPRASTSPSLRALFSENPLAEALIIGAERSPIIESFRDAVARSFIANETRPVVLCVAHHLGGGTEAHLHELEREYGSRNLFLFLRRSMQSEDLLLVSTLSPDIEHTFRVDVSESLQPILDLVSDLKVSHIHIHHLIGIEKHLRPIIERSKLPFYYTIHDYFLLAPNPHLTRGNSFGGEPDPGDAGEDYLVNPFTPPPESIAEWRSRHAWILENAVGIIAPSGDAQSRFNRYYPELKIKVCAHPSIRSIDTRKVIVRPLKKDEPLRVAVFGAMAPHKGADIIEECAILARTRGYPLEFHLIGYAYRPLATDPVAALTTYGAYDRTKLFELVDRLSPHVGWFPALCPETFSYTLSEAFEAALPVVVANIGSLPERVSGRSWSWIEEWTNSPEEWCLALMEIRESLLTGRSCPLPDWPTPVNESRYLDSIYGAPPR